MEYIVIKVRKSYSSSIIEVIKWSSVFVLLTIAVIGSCLYRDFFLLYKIIIISFIVILAAYISLLTHHGKVMLLFSKEAYEEVCKVIWPTFRESFHITVVVIAVTLLISLILWGLDSILVYVVSLGLRL